MTATRRGLFQHGRINDFRGDRLCDASELWSEMVEAICRAETCALNKIASGMFRASFVDECVLGCAIRQRRYCAGCGWVSDLHRRERLMTIQLLEHAQVREPVCLGALVRLHARGAVRSALSTPANIAGGRSVARLSRTVTNTRHTGHISPDVSCCSPEPEDGRGNGSGECSCKSS